MPYDKGDFTQQGINGDVSALVRLNDKRVVKMVLSSDDESSNVDVTGTVYDYLNGETYPLGGTTPTGTITITENGEGIDVSQYALADVNVLANKGVLLLTEDLGALNITSESEISINKTVIVDAGDYDLLLFAAYTDLVPSVTSHLLTASLRWVTAASNIGTVTSCTVVSNRLNMMYNSDTGYTVVKQNSTAYGVYPATSPTVSDNKITFTMKGKYALSATSTINGNYTLKVYGLVLRDLVL